jgi:hypothetical protein
MNLRIHRYLDGELPSSALSNDERREAEALRGTLGSALSHVRREPAPDVTAAVLSAVSPGAAGDGTAPAREAVLQSALGWLWRPRSVTVRFRPALGAAVAAALAMALWRPGNAPPFVGAPIQAGGTVMATSVVEGRILVVFRLDAPGARTVRLAGDFTGWAPGPALVQETPGVWTVRLPIEPGLHDYAFLVDETRWVQDPLAERVNDGFGGSNSRVAVLGPTGTDET